MIRKTLNSTMLATFCVHLPAPHKKNFPSPTGTGFFISPDGYFATAAHVVGDDKGNFRSDISRAVLMKESHKGSPSMCQFIEPVFIDPRTDIAVLKVDFEKNRAKSWLSDRENFPHIMVSSRMLELGEPVYSFGYPLSLSRIVRDDQSMTMSEDNLSPRVTSAIISSDIDKTTMIMTSGDPQHYILDKALNYGNSGGPIIASETGNVHALCSRFQPVFIPQNHMVKPNSSDIVPQVMIPSLYGVVASLRYPQLLDWCKASNIPLSDE